MRCRGVTSIQKVGGTNFLPLLPFPPSPSLSLLFLSPFLTSRTPPVSYAYDEKECLKRKALRRPQKTDIVGADVTTLV